MSIHEGPGFNEWLRTELKARGMPQRQLARKAGVDHSTISRLVQHGRTPSLATATKLARALGHQGDVSQYLASVATTTVNPTARVEYALCADALLGATEVRQVMQYYLALRADRLSQGASRPQVRATRLLPEPRDVRGPRQRHK
jgi:transcriptional regulator with XRE-family HTH domain